MDEREKRELLLCRSKLRQERIQHNNNTRTYEVLTDVELKLTDLVDAYDNSEPPLRKMDRLLEWIRQHPDLPKVRIAEWAGCDVGTLRKAVAKWQSSPTANPVAVPMKYLDRMIDYCEHYGFR